MLLPVVKEKGESKPRQHTIDLSQMAVPIQLAQEKKASPESPRPSTSEAEPSTAVTAGMSHSATRLTMGNIVSVPQCALPFWWVAQFQWMEQKFVCGFALPYVYYDYLITVVPLDR